MKKHLIALSLSLTTVALAQAAPASLCQVGLDGETRAYRLHVPPTLTGPVPVVIALHDEGEQALAFESTSRFSQVADEDNFLVVYPEARGGHWNHSDDVAFLRSVVQDVSEQYTVDPARIFATGKGSGGDLAARLGTQASDLVAAVAPVGADQAVNWNVPQQLVRPVSVLAIDAAPGLAPVLKRWCAASGATQEQPDTGVSKLNRDVFSSVGGNTEVVHVQLPSLGDAWPTARSAPLDATREIWKFFELHPRKAQELPRSRKSPQRFCMAW